MYALGYFGNLRIYCELSEPKFALNLIRIAKRLKANLLQNFRLDGFRLFPDNCCQGMIVGAMKK